MQPEAAAREGQVSLPLREDVLQGIAGKGFLWPGNSLSSKSAPKRSPAKMNRIAWSAASAAGLEKCQVQVNDSWEQPNPSLLGSTPQSVVG